MIVAACRLAGFAVSVSEYHLTFEIIFCQGRIADRTPGAIEGAAKIARALQELTGLSPRSVGAPSPPRQDDWSSSLPEAIGTLTELQSEVADIFRRGQRPLMAMNTCSASRNTAGCRACPS
jgi:arginase/N-omega-hydroxy-L-arginine amidinohydrolase